jgi:putative transposase
VTRFTRIDRGFKLFGEIFRLPMELQYEFVVACTDAEEQKLKLYLNKNQIEQFNYVLH